MSKNISVSIRYIPGYTNTFASPSMAGIIKIHTCHRDQQIITILFYTCTIVKILFLLVRNVNESFDQIFFIRSRCKARYYNQYFTVCFCTIGFISQNIESLCSSRFVCISRSFTGLCVILIMFLTTIGSAYNCFTIVDFIFVWEFNLFNVPYQ